MNLLPPALQTHTVLARLRQELSSPKGTDIERVCSECEKFSKLNTDYFNSFRIVQNHRQ
jgi:hypothetical protein